MGRWLLFGGEAVGSGGRTHLSRVGRAARRLVVAALIVGGLLLGGTAVVSPRAQSVPVPSHAQSAEQAAPTSRPVWGHPTTLGVHPRYDHRLPQQSQNPHLSGERALDVSSGNWAGLAEVGATYTGVSASWTVPTIQASASQKVSSTWIGVDGYSNTDLIQAGTEQDTSGNARTYYSW